MVKDSLNINETDILRVSDEYIIYPNDVVTLKHYNGLTIEIKSLGLCRLVYRGCYGIDFVPIVAKPRNIELILEEPPTKSSL